VISNPGVGLKPRLYRKFAAQGISAPKSKLKVCLRYNSFKPHCRPYHKRGSDKERHVAVPKRPNVIDKAVVKNHDVRVAGISAETRPDETVPLVGYGNCKRNGRY